MFGVVIARAVTHVVGPTAAGLSASDLIAIVAIVVTVFGLLLSAIGILVLRQFDNQRQALDTVKSDAAADTQSLRAEMNNGFTALWGEFRWLRGFLVGDKPTGNPTPEGFPNLEEPNS